VAAWVLIPKNDKSSLIHHMGSQKGREFIKNKPDIDAELHLFLKNYQKKGKFRVFSGKFSILGIMQIRCIMKTMTQ
jgi:hypothetical protein